MRNDELIQSLFKFSTKYIIVFVENRKKLYKGRSYHLQEYRMIGIKNTLDSSVEIVVMEIDRYFLVVL